MDKIEFLEEPTRSRSAVVASFDLSGFSKFCSRPGGHDCINKYLSNLFKFFDGVFGDDWRKKVETKVEAIRVPRPGFVKFTGDGALLMWLRDSQSDFTVEFCTSLVAALRHFQTSLPAEVEKWERVWRVTGLPKSARIGVAVGSVCPLMRASEIWGISETVDYVGYCINLAVRLQDHCPQVSFLAHGPLHPHLEDVLLVPAVKIKGSVDEPVYLFRDEYVLVTGSLPAKELRKEFDIGISEG